MSRNLLYFTCITYQTQVSFTEVHLLFLKVRISVYLVNIYIYNYRDRSRVNYHTRSCPRKKYYVKAT